MSLYIRKKEAFISLIPVLVLVGLFAMDVRIFGSDAILGASQVALLVAAGLLPLPRTGLVAALGCWRIVRSG